MLDLSFLPDPQLADIQVFHGNSSAAGGIAWQTWTKKRGVSMCYIFVLGSGRQDGAVDCVGEHRSDHDREP